MKPAHEPASIRSKTCASLKSPTNLARSPLLVALVRKKKDRGQTAAFPSETSRFKPSILAHRGFSPPLAR